MPAKKCRHFFVFDIKYRKNTQKKREKYKINFHILEAWNFRCRQCFSKFGTKKLLQVKNWEKIVDNCIARADMTEFNIAEGEPMLYPGLVELVQYMRNKEGMSDFIDEIDADQWKILRMKPFQYGNFSNLNVQVSDKEF